MSKEDCKSKHYECKDRNCCISCQQCTLNAWAKDSITTKIKAFTALAALEKQIREEKDRLYKEFAIREYTEDDEFMVFLKVDMPIGLIHYEMDLQAKGKL
jgi:hypothetical protein